MVGTVMYEDNWLESFYEEKSSDDFYTYNSRDFDESWGADTLEPESDLLTEVRQAELWGHVSDEEYN